MAQRPLSPTEALLWHLDRASSLNFTTVAKVQGLTREALRAGLDAVRARHPAFRLRIVAQGGRAPTFLPCELKLPLRESGGAFLPELERELSTRFESHEGPLLRAVWIPTSEHLLLTFQHSVGDGHSGKLAMGEVLAAAAAFLRGDSFAMEPFEGHLSANSRLPRQVRSPRFWATMLAHMARARLSALRLGPALQAGDPDAPLVDRRVHVLPAAVDEQALNACIERARAEGTTLHGLLGAVHMQAIAAQTGARTLQYASPVNLRPRLEPPVNDRVGLFIGSSNTRFAVDPGDAPWPLARALRRSVLRDVQSGFAMLPEQQGARIVRHLTRQGASAEAIGRQLYRRRCSAGLTNLGRVQFEAKMEPLAVQELSFAVAMSCLGDQLATATCFDGRLHWNLCLSTPALELESARQMWADAVARLEASSCE